MSSQNLDDIELENGLDTMENPEENQDFGEINYGYGYEDEGEFVGEFGEFEGEYEDGGDGKYGLEGDEEEEESEEFTWWFWAILGCLGAFVVLVVIGATLFFIFFNADSNAAKGGEPPSYQHNLPDLVSPIEYNLTFKVFIPGYLYKSDERNWTFQGNSSIKVEVLEEKIDRFYMHSAKNLSTNILNISIILNESQTVLDNLKISSYSTDVIEISLGRFVKKNTTLKVDLGFAGKIENNLGIYKTVYNNSKNEERYGIISKFSGELARFVFPCFDEPKWKSIWNIRLIHPKNSKVPRNKQIKKTGDFDEQFRIFEFQPILPISTNQLGFVIGDWDCHHQSKYDVERVKIQVCGRHAITQRMAFVKNDAGELLKNFEDSFGQKYPLEELTILATPDFSNISSKPQSSLGLIVFGENDLLLEEESAEKAYSAKRLEIRANFVGQLAAQWFSGKIENWNDVWVNEGLIGLFGAHGASLLATSDVIRETRILVPKIQKIGLENQNPLIFDLQNEKNLPEKIENINSGKSMGILRMVRKMVGKEIFLNATRNYLMKNGTGNLLENIQKLYDESQEKMSGPLKIVNFSKNWAENSGYPVVFVEKSGQENVKLTQKIWNSKSEKLEDSKTKFEIPLYFWNEEKKNEKLMWLKGDPLIIPSKSGPFILNLDSVGFYRVKYSDEIFESIALKLSQKPDFFTSNTKFRIIEDSLFFKSSKIANLNDYILHEKDPIAIGAFLKQQKIENFWDKSTIKGDWELVEKNYKNDSFIDQVESNLLVIREKCRSKTQDCLEKSKFYWENFAKDCKDGKKLFSRCSIIPTPFRKDVLCILNTEDSSKKMEGKLKEWRKIEENSNVFEDLKYSITCGNSGGEIENDY